MTADSSKYTPAASSAGAAGFTGSALGKSLVWSEEFDIPIAWGARWVGDRTSAYRYANHNPDDNKLDWLDPGCVKVSSSVATFTATPAHHTLENGRHAWRTGLLTTEYSDEGFQVRTGDPAGIPPPDYPSGRHPAHHTINRFTDDVNPSARRRRKAFFTPPNFMRME